MGFIWRAGRTLGAWYWEASDWLEANLPGFEQGVNDACDRHVAEIYAKERKSWLDG